MAQQHGTQSPKDERHRSGGQTPNPGQGSGTGTGGQGDRINPSERPDEQGREGQDEAEDKRDRARKIDPGTGIGGGASESKRDNR